MGSFGSYLLAIIIGSDDGCMPSGRQTLPDPILTQISDDIWSPGAALLTWINFNPSMDK